MNIYINTLFQSHFWREREVYIYYYKYTVIRYRGAILVNIPYVKKSFYFIVDHNEKWRGPKHLIEMLKCGRLKN